MRGENSAESCKMRSNSFSLLNSHFSIPVSASDLPRSPDARAHRGTSASCVLRDSHDEADRGSGSRAALIVGVVEGGGAWSDIGGGVCGVGD